MADKFIIHGETYNGDGTTSAAAASNGAAGAWNNINILTGTAPAYGSLNAGDVVRIRSKTAAGADITITVSAANVSIGKSGLTGTPVVWIFDDGTTWPAATGGVLTFNVTAAYAVVALDYNEFDALTQDAIRIVYAGGTNSTPILTLNNGSVLRRWKCDTTILTSVGSHGPYIRSSTSFCTATLDRLHVDHSIRYQQLFAASNYSLLILIEPDIEARSAAEQEPIFSASNYGARIEIRGGQIRGTGATSGVTLCNSATTAQGVFGIGLTFPYSMSLGVPNAGGQTRHEFVAVDSTIGGFGSVSSDPYGLVDSRDAGNFPHLNAVINDSASTPWAYLLAPTSACSRGTPRTIDIAAPFLASAATATLTLNLLVSTTFTGANKSNVWAVFSYVDNATGAVKVMSTQDNAAGALDSSTASWSAATYGAVSFDKRKLAVTTSTAIKKDSIVRVMLFWGATMVTSGQDIAIIDPAVQAS